MVEYTCKGCSKVFSNKTAFTRHIRKKKPCILKIGSYKDNDHECSRCGKKFSTYSSLYTHVKTNVCSKDKDTVLAQIDKADVVKADTVNIDKSKNVAQNTLNKVDVDKHIENFNLGVDGDVKVVKFGTENLSHISGDLFKQILGRGMRSVQEFIEHVNFHSDHPENHNIYIANIRDEYIVLFDGFKWSVTDRDELMEDIIYARSDYLLVKFNELSHEMDPRDVLKFENFMKRRDDDDVLRKIKGELTLQFYNNRYLPQRQRKMMELLESQKMKATARKISKAKAKKVVKKINMMLDTIDTEDNLDEIKKLLDLL